MTAVRLQLYGGFALDVDQQAIRLSTAKHRVLLAYLLHGPQRSYPRRTLAALFWPDKHEARGLANLSTLLSLLRSSLPDDALVHSSDTQTITLSYGTLRSDTAQVEALVAEISAHPHRALTRCPYCSSRIEQAVRLISGPWLAGSELWECDQLQHWLMFERERQRQQQIRLMETLLAHRERLAQHDAVITLAEQLLTQDPWHEAACAALLRGLAARGRRLTAMTRYRSFAADLQREFAAEPQPELRRLAEQLAQPQPAAVSQPLLITAAAELFGRQQELAELTDLLSQRDVRLVTISGIGGVGKTSLALHAAQQLAGWFMDGAAIVVLDGVHDEASAIVHIAQALGLQLSGQTAPLDQVTEYLAQRELLLVLDNMEQLPSAAALCAAILQRTSRPTLLTTSRRPLQLWQEQVLALQSLAVDPAANADDAAVMLFTARVRRMFGPAMLPPRAVISAICAAVGGLPLAIELAAAQLREQSADVLLQRLQHDSELLFHHAADLPPRQQQMVAILAQAYADLRPDDEAALVAISVNVGQLHAAALAAVLPEPHQAARIVPLLTERGLLLQRAAHRELHPLVRRYVQQQAPTEQLEAARRRHADAWLTQLAAADLAMVDQQRRQRAAQLADDYDNVRAAWLWSVEHEPDMSSGLVEAWLTLMICQGWYIAGAAVFERSAELTVDDQLAAACLTAAGRLLFAAGEFRRIVPLVRAARRRSRAAQICAEAAGLRAAVLHEAGRYQAAQRLVQIGLRTHAAQDAGLAARLRYILARAVMWAGRLEEAQQLYEQVLAAAQQQQNRGLAIDCLNALAQLPARAGDLAASLPLLEQAAEQTRLHGDQHAQIVAFINVGTVRALLGVETAAAQQMMLQALQMTRTSANRRALASVLHSVAYGMIHLGQLTDAERYLAEGLATADAIGHRGFQLEMIEGAALAVLRRGRTETARRWLSAVCSESTTPPFVRQRAVRTLAALEAADAPVVAVDSTTALQEVRSYLNVPMSAE